VKVLRERIIVDHYFDMKDKTDELFVKYMNQPALPRMWRRASQVGQKYTPYILVAVRNVKIVLSHFSSL
jgi:hypothetical protein